MVGKRIDRPDGSRFAPGEYGKDSRGAFLVCPPGEENRMMIGDLSKHDIIEHEDGTITVSPSILLGCGSRSWHGYLDRGVWRTV
jgi:hypothetical protein